MQSRSKGGAAWERRLAQMIMAGGLVATAACTDFQGGTSQDSGPIGCGNANPDPCICGRPDADPMEAILCADEMACQDAGGTYDPFNTGQPDGSITPPHCAYPDGGPPGDDAAVDVTTTPLFDGSVCGNANPDPCICGRPDADPVEAMQCADEVACKADGGTYDALSVVDSDGAVISPPHCTLPDGG